MILGNYHRIVFKPAAASNIYLYTGIQYRIEDFPLEWIDGQYYDSYKDQIFFVDVLTEKKTAAEYQAITTISLANKQLNTNFTNILLNKFTQLKQLFLNENNIATLNVSNSTELKELRCFSNDITLLDTSQLINLVTLLCQFNNIETLDLSLSNKLEVLQCHQNNLTTLDISNSTELIFLYANNNNLTTLDISNSPKLQALRTSTNNLTAEKINTILQDLINNNTPNSQNGLFTYDNITGINGSLENQLTDLGWTLIKV